MYGKEYIPSQVSHTAYSMGNSESIFSYKNGIIREIFPIYVKSEDHEYFLRKFI